jgi:hypothetical protein
MKTLGLLSSALIGAVARARSMTPMATLAILATARLAGHHARDRAARRSVRGGRQTLVFVAE